MERDFAMSRSGYSDDIWDDPWQGIMYRANVDRALYGKRGQAFLKEMLAALDAMPDNNKRLIRGSFEDKSGEVSALGAVGRASGNQCIGPLDSIDTDIEVDVKAISKHFGIARCMAAEIMFENDEAFSWTKETPEQRYERVRRWVQSNITP